MFSLPHLGEGSLCGGAGGVDVVWDGSGACEVAVQPTHSTANATPLAGPASNRAGMWDRWTQGSLHDHHIVTSWRLRRSLKGNDRRTKETA